MGKYYRVDEVNETKFDPDAYGNITYGVKFEGVLDGALIKVKQGNRPSVGDRLFGHFEPTKAGKGQWFRKDQVPEDYHEEPQTLQTVISPESVSKPRSEAFENQVLEMLTEILAALKPTLGAPEDPEMPDDFLMGDE